MPEHKVDLNQPLKFLTADEISMIDRFLADRESCGEVRLIVQNGRLRFLKWTYDVDMPGDTQCLDGT